MLTHDFEFLRMLVTSHRSKTSRSSYLLEKGNDEEKRKEAAFPRIVFLEMRAHSAEAGRTSQLGTLSQVVLKHPSEYQFLFDQVAAGIENPDDHSTLFLLPNAARRLLETFVSFRVPNRPDHRKRLEKLCAEHEEAVFKDIYDFCNRFSHGEGRQMVEPLEASVVLHEISRCMEFIRAVDEPHYLAMMRATGRGEDQVILLPDGDPVEVRADAPAPPPVSGPRR